MKVRIGDQEYINQYLNCAALNVKNKRRLINQSLSKKGRMIIRKYSNIDDEIVHLNELINKRNFKNTPELKMV